MVKVIHLAANLVEDPPDPHFLVLAFNAEPSEPLKPHTVDVHGPKAI